MLNLIKARLREKRQARDRQARLEGYGFGWAKFQLDHWPVEMLVDWLTPEADDYGPEVSAWESGLRDAIHDIKMFTAYRKEVKGYRKAGRENTAPAVVASVDSAGDLWGGECW